MSNQADYPDYYFRVTSNEHMTEPKQKFTRICKQDIIMDHIPKLGAEATLKAIEEWGQPKSRITHIIFCTTVAAEMSGADYKLIKLLGLNPTVKRVMLYHQGCFAGGTVLRIAKDLAENNADARVLVVCSESTVMTFRGPAKESPASLTILPDSEGSISGQLRESGLTFHLSEKVPYLISDNIEKSLFRATKHVLEEYGNMSSACVLFILDEIRKNSKEERVTTTGEELEWGVLFGFGPGLTTIETVVLHSIAIA
ncbi:hypothetical protein CRG98_008761 [Punica granatum]|uniref:Chalcone synthase n=1 Tax=Punica granatum TaxID=22663 RepID=A0A2I0KRD7_PUNGR|nr:hypothetical protein CRG98_008761 [Punica granatum]